MRLIDADELIAEYDRVHIGPAGGARKLMADAPTVDAVEVVRCKDCRYYFHFGKTSLLVDGKNVKAGWCQRRIKYDEEFRMPPDGFCSYGKRKVSE